MFDAETFAAAEAQLEELLGSGDSDDSLDLDADGDEQGPEGTDTDEDTDAGDEAGTDAEGGEAGEATDTGTADAPVELTEDSQITVDGKTVRFGDHYIPKAVFTQKTQETAALQQEAREAIAAAQQVQEIGRQFIANPANAAVEAILDAVENGKGDAEEYAARILVGLNKHGAFQSSDFLEALGMTKPDSPIQRRSKKAETTDELAQLRKEIEELRQAKSTEDRTADDVAFYEKAATAIATREGVSEAEANDWFIELFTFADAKGFTREKFGDEALDLAWAALKGSKPAAPAKPAPRKQVSAEARKAASKVAPKSGSGRSGGPAPAKATSLEAATAQALAQLSW